MLTVWRAVRDTAERGSPEHNIACRFVAAMEKQNDADAIMAHCEKIVERLERKADYMMALAKKDDERLCEAERAAKEEESNF